MCYSQLLIGFVTGIVTSIVGTLLVSRWHEGRSKQRQAEKYGKMAGDYRGFTLEGGRLSPGPVSTAKITYIEANLLEIRLDHDNRSWKGTIAMEIEQYGSLVWQYPISSQDKCEFGFKRCIVNSPDEVYLISEKLDGYDKEVLKRVMA